MIHTETPPGHEGSPEACSILLLLNKQRDGLSLAQVGRELGLETSDVTPALLGLRERHRVVGSGVGAGTVWRIKGPAR